MGTSKTAVAITTESGNMRIDGSGNGEGHSQLVRVELLEYFDGDAELLHDIAETFLTHCPSLMTEVGSAAAARDPARLRDAAHSLKGSVANFRAADAVAAAFRLERMGADGGLDGVEEAYADLQVKMHELEIELSQLVGNA